jgi:hexulose-6-phosphate isomerase
MPSQPAATPSRRDFLTTTSAAALAATTATSTALAADFAAAGAADRAMRPWKKAIMIGMLDMKGASLLDKFKVLKDAGIDGVELNAPNQHKLEEVREACKQTGLLIEGVVDAFHWNINLADPNPAMRATAVEHLKNALRECRAFGGTSCLLVPAIVNKQVSYDDAWKRSLEEIRKAVPVAEETGVKIAIENVWNQFHLSPLEAARYVDEFNSPAVGWHFDIGNIINFGYPEQWIRILGKRIVKLHFKEFSRKKRDEEGLWKGFAVELMEGDNDWPAIMKALDDVGYSTWACAEVRGGNAERMKVLAGQLDKILAM